MFVICTVSRPGHRGRRRRGRSSRRPSAAIRRTSRRADLPSRRTRRVPAHRNRVRDLSGRRGRPTTGYAAATGLARRCRRRGPARGPRPAAATVEPRPLPCLPIEIDERAEPSGLTADDRDHQRQSEHPRTDMKDSGLPPTPSHIGDRILHRSRVHALAAQRRSVRNRSMSPSPGFSRIAEKEVEFRCEEGVVSPGGRARTGGTPR